MLARLEELSRFGAAVLGSCGATIVDAPLAPIWPGAVCVGPARTVWCAAGDNLAIHVAAAQLESGEVLVVGIDGEPRRGYWGEVLTTAVQARGAAGLVIDACVRDTAALAARRFPVFARGTALPDATKHGPGRVGTPIDLGGVTICRGDVIVADGDGIVVLPPERIDTILDGARQRVAREAVMFDALAAGATTIELLDLRDAASRIDGP
jgi:4-hydroxy-4-methyl-2-oxoglutarate aldolase